jgi:Protein of unknown function (DUF3592)
MPSTSPLNAALASASGAIEFDAPAGLIVGNILGFAFLGIALAGTWSLWQGFRSRGWPVADGVVRRCKAVIEPEADDSAGSYNVALEYVYHVTGREYTGRRAFFGQKLGGFLNPQTAFGMEEKLTPGTVIAVRYCPSRPRRSVLQPGPSTAAWAATFVGWVPIALLIVFGHKAG